MEHEEDSENEIIPFVKTTTTRYLQAGLIDPSIAEET